MKSRILSIHYLRGIAAVLVVFFHFSTFLDNYYVQRDLGWIFFGGGAFGVDLFFMISGFVIVLSTQSTQSKSIFIVRRFFRVYPPFIFVFIISALTVYSNNTLHDLIRAAFLIQKDYTAPSPTFGYNILGPAWTLTYEVYFYSIFVVAMSLSHKHRVIISAILLIAPTLILQKIYTGSISFSGNASPYIPSDMRLYGLIRFIASPILIEFVIGMVFYELFTKIKFKVNKDISTLILVVCCGIFTTFYFGNFNNEFGMHGFGIWSIPLLFGFLVYDKYVGFSENRLLSILGDASFSIYISHFAFVNAVTVYNPLFFTSMTGLGKFFFMTTLTGTVGLALHFIIEKPSIKVGKLIERNLKNRTKNMRANLEND